MEVSSFYLHTNFYLVAKPPSNVTMLSFGPAVWLTSTSAFGPVESSTILCESVVQLEPRNEANEGRRQKREQAKKSMSLLI